MTDPCSHWVVGGSGLAHSGLHNAVGSGLYTATTLDDPFTRLGHSQLTSFFVVRQAQRLAIGANHGLWEWRRDEARYVQLHDETLTEVLGLAAVPGDPGLVIACSYGIATAYRDELGAARWTFHSDSPVPDERFANTLYIDPAHPDQWLVGTEAGVFIYSATDHHWQTSDLNGPPVRALCSARGRLWARPPARPRRRTRGGESARGPEPPATAKGPGHKPALGYRPPASPATHARPALGPRALHPAVCGIPAMPASTGNKPAISNTCASS